MTTVTLDVGQVPGLIRRVRRVTDLSQRELAARLSVGAATVARWETGETTPGLREMALLLAVAGWELAVAAGPHGEVECSPDEDQSTHGQDQSTGGDLAWLPPDQDEFEPAPRCAAEPVPMRDDAVRDAAGRHYPPYLDVEPLDRLWRPRWDRPEPLHLCAQRRQRDVRRRRAGRTPADHPTPPEVAAALRDRRAERIARRNALMPPPRPEPEWTCVCSHACLENGYCAPECTCGCD